MMKTTLEQQTPRWAKTSLMTPNGSWLVPSWWTAFSSNPGAFSGDLDNPWFLIPVIRRLELDSNPSWQQDPRWHAVTAAWMRYAGTRRSFLAGLRHIGPESRLARLLAQPVGSAPRTPINTTDFLRSAQRIMTWPGMVGDEAAERLLALPVKWREPQYEDRFYLNRLYNTQSQALRRFSAIWAAIPQHVVTATRLHQSDTAKPFTLLPLPQMERGFDWPAMSRLLPLDLREQVIHGKTLDLDSLRHPARALAAVLLLLEQSHPTPTAMTSVGTVFIEQFGLHHAKGRHLHAGILHWLGLDCPMARHLSQQIGQLAPGRHGIFHHATAAPTVAVTASVIRLATAQDVSGLQALLAPYPHQIPWTRQARKGSPYELITAFATWLQHDVDAALDGWRAILDASQPSDAWMLTWLMSTAKIDDGNAAIQFHQVACRQLPEISPTEATFLLSTWIDGYRPAIKDGRWLVRPPFTDAVWHDALFNAFQHRVSPEGRTTRRDHHSWYLILQRAMLDPNRVDAAFFAVLPRIIQAHIDGLDAAQAEFNRRLETNPVPLSYHGDHWVGLMSCWPRSHVPEWPDALVQHVAPILQHYGESIGFAVTPHIHESGLTRMGEVLLDLAPRSVLQQWTRAGWQHPVLLERLATLESVTDRNVQLQRPRRS